MDSSKNEIKNIVDKYELFEDFSPTNDENIKNIIRHIKDFVPSEKPDAIFEDDGIVFAIEHFQVSLYRKSGRNDVSKIAEGSQCKREKMKDDRDFDLQPSIENFISALRDSLSSHSKSFESYKTNIISLENYKSSEYRLVIFVEDSSKSGYVVRRRETEAVNPLLLKQIAEIFLEFKDSIWGVILTSGNEKQKRITGCTLEELKDRLENNELFDAKDFAPFEVGREVHVSKDDPAQDNNHVTIHLFDRL